MKVPVRGLKIFLLVVLSVVGGYFVWRGFSLPHERWEHAPVGVRDVAEERYGGFSPMQVQLLPMEGFFIVDKNVPVRGVALGYVMQQRHIDGVSMALMHSANERKRGLSLSMVELSGESSGLSMFLAGGSVSNNGCAVALWNMAEQNQGVQIGVVNQVRKDIIIDYDMKPKVKNDRFGVQAGFVNYSEGRGVQIGLWNTNPRSFFRHTPLINFCF